MLQPDVKRVAVALAQSAQKKSKTTYPILAERIGWYNKTGQGLGGPLTEVLLFCKEQGLPILTSIVCKTSTSSPSEGGLDRIREAFGAFDLVAEQNRALHFDWASVPELELVRYVGINFNRIYATRGYGFDPDRWGMLGFGKEGSRTAVIALMGGRPIYVVQFCSPNQQFNTEGLPSIRKENLGRVLGIMEITTREATPETHIDPDFRNASLARWEKDKWPYGLEASRAWVFPNRPFSKDVLPYASKAGWNATNSIVKLTNDEVAALTQHHLQEVPVFGQKPRVIPYVEQLPSVHTYLAICHNAAPLELTKAPPKTFLAKIGITNDPVRRLFELSGNHIAVIFEMKFQLLARREWVTQADAERAEADAHDWAHKHSMHASGEYFYMTMEQIESAKRLILLGK